MPAIAPPLHQQTYSLDHEAWASLLATTDNLLIIQDLDGVCMDLVQDPLHRVIDPAYVVATREFDGHFYVLTNGEHTGQRGVNGLVERAFSASQQRLEELCYLPGLAAGGVQWQGRTGQVEHPGVSEAELAFLAAVPDRIRRSLNDFFQAHPNLLSDADRQRAIESTILDNVASPTANLNTLHRLLDGHSEVYAVLQRTLQTLMDDLLAEAQGQGLGDSFFVHYAPNHGRAADGHEILWWGQGEESGTTDFQFMLRGAIKEAGVLALLNRYYAERTGNFPLGEEFSVRQAPHDLDALLELATSRFDPALMPTIIGVGDTVTSVVKEGGLVQRGGSDRNFLQLVQMLGERFHTGNLVTYVDSSGGELKNRKALKQSWVNGQLVITEGPGDPRDTTDSLTLNVVFPDGYRQYCATFQRAAQQRRQRRG